MKKSLPLIKVVLLLSIIVSKLMHNSLYVVPMVFILLQKMDKFEMY